ncbi:protein BatD [Candidatus Falkowbacteria bacterium]|uniref:Uncharacterized protein n=1 Tax=Candidatus Buchananbacteria bacterium CG10_big_fil_rev_8_21_14_0_10_33_19 TaxID=1974525 RepID=A0A2H0W4U6_9BACT|nr:protein BatD [Candidatus Falkowbacteria bacterium]PIS06373.1 MAG: hypothetical protein COT80_02295 [Candidatus Buchananbacteria bacterium CG10_big_fil_rev_8_21_14_0_10_33_19]
MPLNFVKFFTPERFFHLQPAVSLNTVYFLLVVFGILLGLAIGVKIAKKKTQKDTFYKILLQKYFVMLMTTSVIGLFLVWFRYERAFFLSARFWLLVWFIGFVAWLVVILKYQFKVIPEAREKLQKTQEFNKYLPKKK